MSKCARLFIACLLIALTTLSSCAHKNLPPKTKEHLLSDRDIKEIQAGQKINQHIISNYYLYDNKDINEYVSSIGHSLAKHSKRYNFPYAFNILYDERIYATAAPGGFIYLTTGLINFIESESELAAVLAHEIGRVQYPDPSFSDAKKQFDALSQGGMMIGPLFGPYGALAALALYIVDTQMFTRMSTKKRMEQADELALMYLVNANYDPQGLIDFLYRIQYSNPESKKLIVNYLISHPLSLERIENVEKVFKNLQMPKEIVYSHRDLFMQKTAPIRQIYGKI